MRTTSDFGPSIRVAALALLLAAPALAEQPQEGQMPPEVQAMMEAWQAAMTPGEAHAGLAAMAGSWTFAGTFWMGPEAPPSDSSGAVERRMILDGRVLEERVESSFMGSSFDGLGFTGFDNVSGEYWSIWMDSMSTGVAISTGACDEGVCEFRGSYNDPAVGGPKPVRMVLEQKGDHEVFEVFEPAPDGSEFRSMRLVYTRVK